MNNDEHMTRLPDETPTAYAHYIAYRDMPPPRNITSLATNRGCTTGHLHNLSSRHQWADRLAEWDARAADTVGQTIVTATAVAAADLHTAVTRLHMTAVAAAQAVIDGIDPDAITAQQTAVLRSVLAGMTRVALPDTETAATNYATDPVRAERIRELAAKATGEPMSGNVMF